MKIFMASALDLKDRGAQSLKETIKAYSSRGHKIFFVTYKKKRNHPDYFYEDMQTLDLDNFHRFSLELPLTFLINVPFVRRIVVSIIYPIIAAIKFREITGGEVDILYGYEVQGVLACVLIRIFHKLPLVSRFQGTVLHPLFSHKLSLIKYLDYILALKCPADLIVMTNDGTRGDIVLRNLEVDMSKVRFWINGVPKGLYNLRYRKWIHRKNKLNKSTKVLLTLSRLVHWKRVDRAIHALKYIVQKVDAVLVIVGDGPEKEVLMDIAKKEGVAEKVIFTGAVPHSEVKKFLNSCDVFLSLYDLSNLGNPVLEAMSCGRCVVTLNKGEMESVIEDGTDGILIDYSKRGEIGSTLVKLLGDDNRRRKIGKNAFYKAKSQFWSWGERMDAEIEEVQRLVKYQC